MARKPTYKQLEQKVLELGKEVRTRTRAEDALKDYTSYQSVLAALRGVRPEQSEEVLLQVFLSEIIKQYGFCMSWYGRYADGEIRPILSAGRVDRYLDNLVLEVREPTSPDAHCAISHAILKAVPFSYADLERDEGFRKWRDYALELGYRSNLALPLEVDGQVEGGVMVYADTPHAFPKERIERLQLLTLEIGKILHERRLRQKAEEALKESGERYRRLVEDLGDRFVIFGHMPGGDFTYISPSTKVTFGIAPEQAIGRRWQEVIDWTPDSMGLAESTVATAARGEHIEPVELTYTHPDGSVRIIEVTGHPVTDESGAVVSIDGIAMDVTERKRTEEAIRHSEEKYRTVVETAHDMIFTVDLKGNFLFTNRALDRILGYSHEEIKKINGFELVHPEDLETVKDRFTRLLSGKKVHNLEYKYRTKKGKYIHILNNASPLFDSQGDVVAAVGIARDITELKQAQAALQEAYNSLELEVHRRTAELVSANKQMKIEIEERKRVEAALRESEERFRQAFENANTGMALVGLDGRHLKVNSLLCEILGYSQEELENMTVDETTHPEDLHICGDFVRRAVAGETSSAKFEKRHLHKQGHVVWVDVATSAIRDSRGTPTHFIAQVQDITDRRQKEAALREKDKELEIKANSLEEVNTALRVLVTKREEDKAHLEEKVLCNVKDLVFPYVERLKKSSLDANQTSCVCVIETNLSDIISPFARKLSSKYLGLTPAEVRVANLVKDGNSTKEMAEFMNLSRRTVESHRVNIRKKLGIKNIKANLRTYLSSIQ